MRFFVHLNDDHETPTMEHIIAELGCEGYGHVNILLETLAKHVPNDGKAIFQLSLVKPTDLAFWMRKFRQSNTENTERTFDIFYDAGLITEWRETQTICVPMLGERLDDYTEKKRRKRVHQVDGQDNQGVHQADGEKTAAIERVWAYYVEKLGKSKVLTLTLERRSIGLARIDELILRTGGKLDTAEAMMKSAIDALAASPFHRGDNDQNTRFDSWEKHLFDSEERVQEWIERSLTSTR